MPVQDYIVSVSWRVFWCTWLYIWWLCLEYRFNINAESGLCRGVTFWMMGASNVGRKAPRVTNVVKVKLAGGERDSRLPRPHDICMRRRSFSTKLGCTRIESFVKEINLLMHLHLHKPRQSSWIWQEWQTNSMALYKGTSAKYWVLMGFVQYVTELKETSRHDSHGCSASVLYFSDWSILTL